jgi:hypothetical protein
MSDIEKRRQKIVEQVREQFNPTITPEDEKTPAKNTRNNFIDTFGLPEGWKMSAADEKRYVADAPMNMGLGAMGSIKKLPPIKRVADQVGSTGGVLGLASKGANLEGKAVFGKGTESFGKVGTPDMAPVVKVNDNMRGIINKMMEKHRDERVKNPAKYQELKQTVTDFVKKKFQE